MVTYETDLGSIKNLFEGQYLIAIGNNKNEESLLYIKSVNDLEALASDASQIDKVIYDSYEIIKLNDDYEVKITHNCKKRLFTLLYNFSFSTKEAFMNYYNKAIEEIQKGVEK